jgi:GMP synthase (glutamine-hydrolysing)
VERRIPVLGICYGHQLLAYALGGTVENNPNGREYGTAQLKLTPEAKDDPLFHGLPNPLKVQESHTQSVRILPPGAALLAGNEKDPCQAFVMNENAWGVQFHPEFDAEIVRAYIRVNREALAKEGQNPDKLIKNCSDNEFGGELLRRFAKLVAEKLH